MGQGTTHRLFPRNHEVKPQPHKISNRRSQSATIHRANSLHIQPHTGISVPRDNISAARASIRQSLKPKLIQSQAMSSHEEGSDTFRNLSKTVPNAPHQICLFFPSLCPRLEVESEHSLGRYHIRNWDLSSCHHRQVAESHGFVVEVHRRLKVD